MSTLSPNTTSLQASEGQMMTLLDWMYSLTPTMEFDRAPYIRLDSLLRIGPKYTHHPDTKWLFRVRDYLVRVRVLREAPEKGIAGDPIPLEVELAPFGVSTAGVKVCAIRRPELLLMNLLDFADEHGGGAA